MACGTPDGLRPLLTPAEPVDEIRGRGLRPLVAPGHRGPHGVALRVERHQRVLLRGDPDGLHAFEQPAARGLAEREEPRLWIDIGGTATALAGFERVRGIALLEHGTGVRVTDHDPSEIGRTVQPGDYPHD